uniref:Uncharacterized protein n=1 Tax=Biomphalaria glabrata TaxID=6526 RepID=A0A2C9L278_BIOGL
MKNPSILESMSEMVNMTFWCYFCQSEITKHKEHFTAMGHCMIELGGMLEHFTRQDHVDNTVQFLRENKKDLVLTSDYIVSTEAYLKYLEVVDVSCSQFLKNKSDSLKLNVYVSVGSRNKVSRATKIPSPHLCRAGTEPAAQKSFAAFSQPSRCTQDVTERR